MARQSAQHKLDRVRPPRVQITYDVEIGGAIEIKELPRKLLKPYLQPADKQIMGRLEHVARQFEELEFVRGQSDWNTLLEVGADQGSITRGGDR